MQIDLSEFRDRPSKRCVSAQRIATLSEEERETVNAALAERDIATPVIARWLSKRGVSVNRESLRQHRLNECACRG